MNQLVQYDAMCRAIDACYQVDEVKAIRDKALAIEMYAMQAKNIEAERRAVEIRLRAERKAGQLLAEMKKSEGGRPSKNPSRPATGLRKTLGDVGVSKDQSSRWQKLAQLPLEEFEAALRGDGKPSTNRLIKNPGVTTPVHPTSLWVWGRLMDFERNGTLALSAADVLSNMTSEMREDTRRLTPLIIQWLTEMDKIA